MPADRSDRPWCLDLRELRPRGGPAFGGFRPPLQWLRPGPSDGPDSVEVPPPANLVLRSPVRDGHLVKHVPNPSCSSPPPMRAPANLTRNLSSGPGYRLNALSSLADSSIRAWRRQLRLAAWMFSFSVARRGWDARWPGKPSSAETR